MQKKRTYLYALWFSPFCPLIKYIFSAQSFQALANHWRKKVYKVSNREEIGELEL